MTEKEKKTSFWDKLFDIKVKMQNRHTVLKQTTDQLKSPPKPKEKK